MKRRKRKWDEALEDDPAAGLLNLFDVWIAFAAALLLAMVSYYQVAAKTDLAAAPGRPQMEQLQKDGTKLDHYRVSKDAVGGDGERLGTAYRLKSGEVIYVPEAKH